MVSEDPTEALPRSHGAPPLRGGVKATPDDFVVEEVLGYGPSGAGEHAFITVRKRGRNTHDIARALARLCGVAQVAVGYAGLKDRNAVTTQSFSVHLAGRCDPDWRALEDDTIAILDVSRHHRKIRRGALQGNRFVIRVSAVDGGRAAADRMLDRIRRLGVPNYFGSQRFGRRGQNLLRFARLLDGSVRRIGREQRGLLFSAARAELFNRVVAARVQTGTWNRALPGDVFTPAGSRGQFLDDGRDPTLCSRVADGLVHPTGPLCGRPSRSLVPTDEAARVEQRALATRRDWIAGLQRFGLDADRRALRLSVDGLDWQWQDHALVLAFRLPAGSYATVVLRELLGGGGQTSVQGIGDLRDSRT